MYEVLTTLNDVKDVRAGKEETYRNLDILQIFSVALPNSRILFSDQIENLKTLDEEDNEYPVKTKVSLSDRKNSFIEQKKVIEGQAFEGSSIE